MRSAFKQSRCRLLIMTAGSLLAQSVACGQGAVLTLSPGFAAPGTSLKLDLVLHVAAGTSPAGIEWTFSYSTSDFTGMTASAAGSAVSAGKTIVCAGAGDGQQKCILTGMNAAPISNDLIASVTFNVAKNPAHAFSAINLLNPVSASPAGDPISTGATGSTVFLGVGVPTLSSFTCAPSVVSIPGSFSCAVALSGPAVVSATVAAGYSTATGSVLNLPLYVLIPAGSASATLTGETSAATANGTAQLTVTLNSQTLSQTLQLRRPPVKGLIRLPGPPPLAAGHLE